MTETMREPEATAEAVGAVLTRLMGDFAAATGTLLTYLGGRLGLWDALAGGPAAAEVVANRAGLAVPYVREWLRSQSAAGYVDYDAGTGDFSVAPGVVAVFGSGPLSGLAAGVASQLRVYWAELERDEEAFRSGNGIAWGELPKAHADGMDLITRAVVVPALGASVPRVDVHRVRHRRLLGGPGPQRRNGCGGSRQGVVRGGGRGRCARRTIRPGDVRRRVARPR